MRRAMEMSKPLLEALKAPVDPESATEVRSQGPKRSSDLVFISLVVLLLSSWGICHYQLKVLPAPLSAEQAGERGFSEVEAVKHLQALTRLGPHSVGSHALDVAVQYVLTVAETIKNKSHGEVNVEVEHFHSDMGVNRLDSGLSFGQTIVYADLYHVLMRISPRNAPEARENAVLVSAHIDTVFSGEGAGDDTSNIAMMLELAQAISQSAYSFKNSVIFFFNTGEEEGLCGSHSFMTQHPWRHTVRLAVDLEAMGLGGKSHIFQTGPQSLAIEKFGAVAKYPSAQILAQDIFSSGIINSGSDFQVYMEIGGLSELDFAFWDKTAVYHTRNDKFELLKPGSLQHLGENMLPFLLEIGSYADLAEVEKNNEDKDSEDVSSVYFDILGRYMIVYRKQVGKMLNNSVIMLSLCIWSAFFYMGGEPYAVSFVLSCLSILLMLILSVSSSLLVGFILTYISSSPVPYIRFPWLVIGLFGAPSLIGALAGQHLGFRVLEIYLSTAYSKKKKNLSTYDQPALPKLEAERWLYKAGTVAWLVLLAVSDYLNLGSSYIPLIWLVSPAIAYGLLEATYTPIKPPGPLKIATLMVGLFVPVVVSVGPVIDTIDVLIGNMIRIDSNPGSMSEWTPNAIVSALVAVAVCLMLVYILSYVHLSGAGRSIIVTATILFGLSLAAILSGFATPYAEDFARTLQVTHVADVKGMDQEHTSYISLSSLAPGSLAREIEQIGEGFFCGRNMSIDFATFSVHYGCLTYDGIGRSESYNIPKLHVGSDLRAENRATVTPVLIDTTVSTRWAVAVDFERAEDFELEVSTAVGSAKLVTLGHKNAKDGRHIIRFAGGKNAPTNFTLNIHSANNSSLRETGRPRLRVRFDIRGRTLKVDEVLKKLPYWCSLFGKSTSPYNQASLHSLDW